MFFFFLFSFSNSPWSTINLWNEKNLVWIIILSNNYWGIILWDYSEVLIIRVDFSELCDVHKLICLIFDVLIRSTSLYFQVSTFTSFWTSCVEDLRGGKRKRKKRKKKKKKFADMSFIYWLWPQQLLFYSLAVVID